MPDLTTTEQLNDLTLNGYGIGLLQEHNMYWGFRLDQQDDRKINWLDSSDWNCQEDVCAGEIFSGAVSRTHQQMLKEVESSMFLGNPCSALYREMMEERAKRPKEANDKAEVKPGSPEDRILMAVIEGMEASGEVITPEIRNDITCWFMMGYIAGFSVAGTTAIFEFLGEEKAEKLNVLTVENTIKNLIQHVNEVVLTDMLPEE